MERLFDQSLVAAAVKRAAGRFAILLLYTIDLFNSAQRMSYF